MRIVPSSFERKRRCDMRREWMLFLSMFLSMVLIPAAWAQPAAAGPGGTPPGISKPGAVEPYTPPKARTHGKAVAIFTDPSKPVEVTAGDTFRIVLEANATTGYRWQLADKLDEKIVRKVHSRYRGPIARRPGAGGHEFWRFYAVAAGTTEIRMVYVRSWEKGVEPAREAVFKVTVK